MKTHLSQLRKNAPVVYALCEQLAVSLHRDEVLPNAIEGFKRLGQQQGGAILVGLASSTIAWGSQTFEVPSELSAMLTATDLSGVTSDEIRLPYGAFFVATPGCGLQVMGTDGETLRDVTGIYVGDLGRHSNGRTLLVCLWGEQELKGNDVEDASTWIRLTLRDGEDVETYIRETLNDHTRAVVEVPSSDTQRTLEAQTLALSLGCRLALNLAMYLSSDNPETEVVYPAGTAKLRAKLAKAKSAAKAAKLRNLLAKQERQRVTLVGRKLAQRYREAAAAAVRSGVSPHWVRGHYRTYWTGEGRQTKTRRWVMPFPRGFDGAEPEVGTERAYKVEKQP